MIRYRGLTWDHPRGYHPLAAAARRLGGTPGGIAIDWEKQPLAGFESHPIRDLCERYDLVVLDHPHVGEAVASACLAPLEDVFEPGDIDTWSELTVGRCLASYRYGGRHWALPLDAATQVMALRADLVDCVPDGWDEVIELSTRHPVAFPTAGPHPILTFFSLSAALGDPPAEGDPAVLVSVEAGERALDIMATLYGRMPEAARGRNPIDLLRLMTGGDEIALCPLVYGYVTYAVRPDAGGRPVAFRDAPRIDERGRRGSTLGGTGIGISRRCHVTPDLVAHLRWLLGAEAQVCFIPAHDGQPSRREAWLDESLNARCGNFYRNTIETVEGAYVRPRHNGYVGFQTEASTLLRQALDEHTPHRTVLERLQAGYSRSRPEGAER